MKALIALCLALQLSGCIPIGVRGSTMPLTSAADPIIRGVPHAGPADSARACTAHDSGPAVSLRRIGAEALPA